MKTAPAATPPAIRSLQVLTGIPDTIFPLDLPEDAAPFAALLEGVADTSPDFAA